MVVPAWWAVVSPCPVAPSSVFPISWPSIALDARATVGKGEKGEGEGRCVKSWRSQIWEMDSESDLRWVPPWSLVVFKALRRPLPAVLLGDKNIRCVTLWTSQGRNRSKRWISSLPSENTISMEASSWGFATVLIKPKAAPQMHSTTPIGRLFDLEINI